MTFAELALICLVALVGPLLSVPQRLGVPVVVGELICGIALGDTGARVLRPHDPTFAFLADIGFALVMFVAGSHVPIRNPALRAGALIGLGRAVLAGVVAAPVGILLSHLFATGHAALYAVICASSSASLVMPALAGKPLTGGPMVALLAQLAIADAVCIVALPLVIDPAHVARTALGAAAVLLAGGVIFALLRWLEDSGRRRRVHDLSEDRGLAIELRTSLVLLFALVALAQTGHVSIMLAGFVLGLAVAGIGEPRRLTKQLVALSEGLFAPIFFVWLGAGLDLRDLGRHPSAIWLGLGLGIGGIIAHLVGIVTRQPWPVAVIAAAQLGLPVAAATTGTRLGVLRAEENTALLLGALISIVSTAAVSAAVSAIAVRTAPQATVAGATAAPGSAGPGGTA